MNIKVVFNKKLHRLSNNLKTLQDIRAAIKNIYKEKLNDTFRLHVQIDQYSGEMIEIETDDQLQYCIKIYQQNDWPSVKILVQDASTGEINQQDLDLLNQSMMNASKIKPKVQQVQEPLQQFEVAQQTEQKEQKDVDCSNHPIQADQFQQTKVENQNIAIQYSVPSQDHGQNTVINQALQGLNLTIDNPQLQDLIVGLIDQRLRYYNLIKAENQAVVASQILGEPPKEPPKPAVPEMFLKEIQNVNIVIQENSEMEQRLTVVNKGKEQWPKSVELRGVSGPLSGLTVQVPDLAPAETGVIVVKQRVEKPHSLERCDFKLFYMDVDGQAKAFGQRMSFDLTVQKKTDPQPDVNASISVQDKKPQEVYRSQQQLLMKAKEIKQLFPHADLKEIIEFIKLVGVDTPLDDLMEACLMNAKFAQQ